MTWTRTRDHDFDPACFCDDCVTTWDTLVDEVRVAKLENIEHDLQDESECTCLTCTVYNMIRGQEIRKQQ